MSEKPTGEMSSQPKLEKSRDKKEVEETSALDLPISFTVTSAGNNYYDLMSIEVRKDGTVVNQHKKPLSREEIFNALDKAAGFLCSEIQQVEKDLLHLKDKQKKLAATREFLKQHVKGYLRPEPSG